ncbi:Kinesin-like protein kif3a [Kappamyces sp. JEL0680]|nr:Kinesin-like protein kif3a [Kappamyces sp. JEL0680]
MADNVRVAIRVRNLPQWHGRPDAGGFNIKETAEYNANIVALDAADAKSGIAQHLQVGLAPAQPVKDFSFDYVFGPESGQSTVYDSLISPLISKCLSGYNGCVFAYGQTASGKTYTMGGPAVSSEKDRGIILRVARQLCSHVEANGRKDYGKPGFDYSITGSYLEIYNEQLKDLLADGKEELKIRMDPRSVTGKDVYVQGQVQKPLATETDYINLIATGVSKRKVAETNMNAVSSRSHAILTLNITQREYLEGGKEGITRKSKIHLIDLAGSERAESTGATGAVLKEGAAINQSLSCLGNVINALTTGQSHIPYRDSKLTHILSDSLGGNSLTVLVACLTPISGAYDETLSTLRFAERVKKIKNKAILNVDANVLKIMALQAENTELKHQLAAFLAACNCGAAKTTDSGGQLADKLGARFKSLTSRLEKGPNGEDSDAKKDQGGWKGFLGVGGPKPSAVAPLETLQEDDPYKEAMVNAITSPLDPFPPSLKNDKDFAAVDRALEEFVVRVPYEDLLKYYNEDTEVVGIKKRTYTVLCVTGLLMGLALGYILFGYQIPGTSNSLFKLCK